MVVGQTLSHYRILEKLGAGGMGEVYLAEDTSLKRLVALKVLSPGLTANQERLKRFQREAELLAALNHPNIVTLYSVEEADGVRFLTMELVEGKTLLDSLPKQGVLLEQFFDIALPLANALCAAHERGIVHRDLKPGNVMMTEQGAVKILDFGLAKLWNADHQLLDSRASTELITKEGRIVGTVPYMSPEQIQGKPVDDRSDIFSLGIILYQVATGRKPFKGDSAVELASSILRDTPVPVDDLKVGLPHQLGRIIRYCLEKDPERRYQTAKDLRNELEDLKREATSQDFEIPRAVPSSRQRAATKWAVLAGTLVLVALAAVISWRLTRQEPRLPTVRTAEAQQLLDQGYLFELRGETRQNLEAAADRYRRALEVEPDNPLLQSRLAALLARMQMQYPEEERAVEIHQLAASALEQDPDLAGAQVALGRVALIEGDGLAAERAARRVNQAAPQDYSGYTLLGEALIAQGRVDEGLIQLHQGVLKAGTDVRARLALAREFMHLGRYSEAAAEYEEVLEYAPDSPSALNNLAIIYVRMGRDLDAIPLFQRILRVQPDEAAASNLGVIYFYLGRMQEAIEAFQKAHELAPDLPYALHNLGDAYEALGDLTAAREWYEQALVSYDRALAAGGPRANRLALRSLCAAKLGRSAEARTDVEEALALEPKNSGLLFNAAQVYALEGDVETMYERMAQALGLGHPRQDFHRDSCFRSYQDDARFRALLESDTLP